MSDAGEAQGASLVAKEPEAISFAEFLEEIAPTQQVKVSDLFTKSVRGTSAYYELQRPELQLHCSKDTCNGLRFFRSTTGDLYVKPNEPKLCYITYRCSNCQSIQKTFSLHIWLCSALT